MKKFALLVVAFIAVVAGLFVAGCDQSKPGKTASADNRGRAAEFVPGETIAFLHLPDLKRTSTRWQESVWKQIAAEPEWQEFSVGLKKLLDEKSELNPARDLWSKIEAVDPQEVFVALTSFSENTPQVVAGISYAGSKTQAEALAKQLRDQIASKNPAMKSDVKSVAGVTVETLSGEGKTFAQCLHENWFLFATDVTLLEKTLTRISSKGEGSLAKDPIFTEARKNVSEDPDGFAYVNFSVLMEKFATLLAASGAQSGQIDLEQMKKMKAVVATTKLEGAQSRDRIFIYGPEMPKQQPMQLGTLALTSASTYLFGAVNMEVPPESMTDSQWAPLEALPAFAQVSALLAAKDLKIKDLFTAFGPEVGVVSDWDAVAPFPTLLLAVQVRDKAKARAFAEVIAGLMGSGEEVATSEREGTTFWSAKAPIPAIQPTLAANEQYVFFGLNALSIQNGLAQLKKGTGNLGSDPAYQKAMGGIAKPVGTALFLNTKTLFESLYDKARPLIAMKLATSPDLGKYVDAGKMPKTETISKHLVPMVLSSGSNAQGILIESTGPITFSQLYATLPVFAVPALMGMGSPDAPHVQSLDLNDTDEKAEEGTAEEESKDSTEPAKPTQPPQPPQ